MQDRGDFLGSEIFSLDLHSVDFILYLILIYTTNFVAHPALRQLRSLAQTKSLSTASSGASPGLSKKVFDDKNYFL